MSESVALSGADLELGIRVEVLRDGEPLLGHAHGEAVMLVRQGSDILALGATCSHYGGPLAEGLVTDGTVRCPWHHACFDLRTGNSLGGPALSPIACLDVLNEGGLIRIGKKRPEHREEPPANPPRSVAIIGAGPAGTACAETLRREGFDGPITLLGAEPPGPVDRPNLSKDYLAGSAPAEWIPLRTIEALAERGIELVVDDRVLSVDAASKTVTLASGRRLPWGVLVLATGAEPVRLEIEGASLPHVHSLRTLGDAQRIIDALPNAKRAVVVGSSFIGLEAAASLRKRGLDVIVTGPDRLPLGRVLGEEVGQLVKAVHEENGVAFQLGKKPIRITKEAVELDDHTKLEADLVVVGIGVRPRIELAEALGLRVDNGIVVDARFRASLEDVYAAGDVARFPLGGGLVRVEHFAVAERHGQAVARAIVGRPKTERDVPFFWSQHHDLTLSYVGHAPHFEAAEVHGDLSKRDATVAYRDGGRIRAVLTIGRDATSLAIERAMELEDHGRVESLVATGH